MQPCMAVASVTPGRAVIRRGGALSLCECVCASRISRGGRPSGVPVHQQPDPARMPPSLTVQLLSVLLLLLSAWETDAAGAFTGAGHQQRWGVNVHFNWAGFSGLSTSARMIAGAFGSSRMDLSWSHVERTTGVYDFESTGYSAYVRQLLGTSPPVRPYFILCYGNTLYDNSCTSAQRHDGTCPPITDLGRQAFANFTVAAMRRWRGKGIIWELWNVS
jgi:hypothetical protein